MKRINTFIVPYDSGSRIAKVSQSLQAWKKIFPSSKFLERQYSTLLPYMVEAEVHKSITNNSLPLMIGGDHSLTYYSCKSLTSFYGPIHLIVFDAHHDSYSSNYLNHYTVFHHMQSQLRTKIHLIGCRKDLDKNTIRNCEIGSPCYLSLDVDFFSPRFVSSVVDPVECDNERNYSFEYFCSKLDQLDCEIIGGDIVEWGGHDEDSEEFAFIKKVSEKMLDFMNTGS